MGCGSSKSAAHKQPNKGNYKILQRGHPDGQENFESIDFGQQRQPTNFGQQRQPTNFSQPRQPTSKKYRPCPETQSSYYSTSESDVINEIRVKCIPTLENTKK